MQQSIGRKENMTMRALYLLGILFIVDGHTQLGNWFDLGGLFKYYSFHLMLFAFGSGYFYSDRPLKQVILKKAKSLLLPLYLWNLVYGIGTAVLRKFGGFEFGHPLNFYTLLIAPVTDGEQFVLNLGAWFLFPLFFVQIFYAAVRKLIRPFLRNEWAVFLLFLIPGCIAAQLCTAGRQDALPLYLMRSLILLPGYAAGVLYRRKLETLDSLPTVPYLFGIMALRLVLCLRYENLAYLLSSCTYITCGAFGVYAGAALAIAFWLRIARLLAPYLQKSSLALYTSRHTFDIMMHHYMGYFAVNCVFLILNYFRIAAGSFSVLSFRTVENYCYAPGGHAEFNGLYIAAGILLPLLIAKILESFRKLFPASDKSR